MPVYQQMMAMAAVLTSCALNSAEAGKNGAGLTPEELFMNENGDIESRPNAGVKGSMKLFTSRGARLAGSIPKVDLVELQNRTGLIFGPTPGAIPDHSEVLSHPAFTLNKHGKAYFDPKNIFEDQDIQEVRKGGGANLRRRADGTEEEEEYEAENLDDANGGRNLNIFLPDLRVEVDETAYPYRAVGIFGGCTAEAIYSNVIITNAHCLDYFNDGSFNPSTWNKVFYAGFSNGNYVAYSGIKRLLYSKYYDHAVIQLQKPLSVGWFGQKFQSQSAFSNPVLVQMISYSGDHCSAWNNCRAKMSACYTRGKSGNHNVKHSCDATRGSSGSAMFTGPTSAPYMVLLNFAEDRNGGEVSLTLPEKGYLTNPNYAKPGATWYNDWVKIRSYGTN